jgi:hypothetical protein
MYLLFEKIYVNIIYGRTIIKSTFYIDLCLILPFIFDIKTSYQTDSPVEPADSPAAISKVQRNPIPRKIFRYIRNLNLKEEFFNMLEYFGYNKE